MGPEAATWFSDHLSKEVPARFRNTRSSSENPMTQARPVFSPEELPRSDVASCTRRRVLRVAGCTMGMALFAAGAPGCGAPTGSPPTGPVPAGTVSGLSIGAMHVISHVLGPRHAHRTYPPPAL